LGRRKKRRKNSPFNIIRCRFRRAHTIHECTRCGRIEESPKIYHDRWSFAGKTCAQCRNVGHWQILGHRIEYEELTDDAIVKMITQELGR